MAHKREEGVCFTFNTHKYTVKSYSGFHALYTCNTAQRVLTCNGNGKYDAWAKKLFFHWAWRKEPHNIWFSAFISLLSGKASTFHRLTSPMMVWFHIPLLITCMNYFFTWLINRSNSSLQKHLWMVPISIKDDKYTWSRTKL